MNLCFLIDPDDWIPFEVDPLVEDPLWFHSHPLSLTKLMDFGIVNMKTSVVPEFSKDVCYETQGRSSKTPD